MNLSTQWLPALPNGWQIANPKSLFSERIERSVPSDTHLTPSQKFGVLPQTEYMEISGGSVVLNLTGSENMKHVEKNDFIIHLRSFQGGIEYSNYSGKVSNAYCVLKPNQLLEPRFMKWVLKSQGYIQELNATTDQLRDGQSIKFHQFASIGLPLPPIEEQRRIADYLDEQCHVLDRVHDQHEKVQTNVLELTKSEREKLIRGGAKGKKFVPGWLGEIDEDWLTIRLGRIASFKSGVGFPDEYQGKSYGDFPFMKVADLGSADSFGILKTADNYVDQFDAKLLGARVAPAETIVFPKVGAALLNNRRAILGVPSIFDNNVMGLLFKDGNNRFWYHVLRSVDMGRIMNPGPVPSIGASQVSEIVLPFPPLDEQSKIASRLDEIDQMESNLLSKNEAVKVKLAEYKKSLITTAVLGEIDVTSGKRVA
jgi:type I restriction enzyme S subunit